MNNPFEISEEIVSTEIKEIKKSDIFDAICREDSEAIRIKKTAKQIKDQVNNVLIPANQVKLEEIQNSILNLLLECGNPPTKDIYCYKIKIDVPFKEYTWNETNFREKDEGLKIYNEFAGSSDLVADSFVTTEEALGVSGEVQIYNWPISKEQSLKRLAYNEKVSNYIEVLVDLKTLKALDQLNEESYSLSVPQVMALGFDKE